MGKKIHPVDLQLLLAKLPPRHPVALDTETSVCGRMVP